MVLTSEALYWFFSTIAQTLGAIVGVVGMLTVFKLQNITASMQQLVDNTLNQRSAIFEGEKALNQTPKDVVTDFYEKWIKNDKIKEYEDNASVRVIHFAYLRIINSFDIYKKIRFRFFFTFLIPQLVVIFFSIESLLFSENMAHKITIWSFATWAIPVFLGYLCISTIDMLRILLKADYKIDVKKKSRNK